MKKPFRFETKSLNVQQTRDLMRKYAREHKETVKWSKYRLKRLDAIRIRSVEELPKGWQNDLYTFIEMYRKEFPSLVELYIIGSVASGKAIIKGVTSKKDSDWLKKIRNKDKQTDIDVYPVLKDGKVGERMIYKGKYVKVEVPALAKLHEPYIEVKLKRK